MIQIIPAIDLIDGKCIRLNQGNFEQKKIYSEDPVTIAQRFADAGLQRLHLVDLDGARYGQLKHLSVLEHIARSTNLTIDYSGGLKTDEDMQSVLDAGATFLSVGSMAIKKPAKLQEWITRFGANRIILGADVSGEQIAIDGWQEITDKSVYDFLTDWYEKGIRQAFCTSISRDGMMQGPDTALYKRIKMHVPELSLIASGGVRDLQDVEMLEQSGCSEVIIGKAFYEGTIQLSELKRTFIS